ncbi:lysylphosphatidylglycerol synthase transmembrane domain-containing protein [Luteipulveratus flavus]|uniref:Lysylphosphatidylglycerol synthase transmembrane domain-containing protein n=1 Tax=Luteipulveratus flavus TaxID=3031728 RepID=A0ABT6C2Z1_9MICO|nr:lysylphosphatidylglycerol synthase transmembrane domain-containing protein [Luteipulveratus sp. YIM 133296]MDF8263138.1 lysylphosphatidylglycerol synthase transmembrane domain-containing protein [Luteipulveratus sp. YIM 133296]
MNESTDDAGQAGQAGATRLQASPEDAPTLPRPSLRTTLHAVLGLSLAVAIIAWGLPHFAETTWGQIGHHLQRVGWMVTLELFGLMALGLWLYTFTLTGSLPGLTHGKALMMNVAGSAVGNLLPGGGAAGVGVTYLFARSWGFSRLAISTSVIVSGVWNVLARVGLPFLGIAMLALDETALPKAVRRGALFGGLGGLLVLLAFIAMVVSERWAGRLGEFLDRHIGHWIARLRRGPHKGERVDLRALLQDQRSRLASVTKTGWLPMTVGVTGFLGIYFVLFWRTMAAVGVDIPTPKLFAAYAIGRLLTAVGVTPGGLGITEAGTLTVLVAWGADKPAAAAGVLLFAIFTHISEVPLGALGWLGWTLTPKVTPPD